MSRAIGKLRTLHSELGPLRTALYLFSRLYQKSSRRAWMRNYQLVAQPVPAKPLLAQRSTKSRFAIREVSSQDYQLGWFPRPQHIIDFRFKQGAHCFVAFKDECAVGCLWLQLGPYNEDEVRCQFQPYPEQSTAWDFDVYIVPELRLGRLFVYLWDHAYAWLRERDVQWSVSRISPFNIASVRSHQRLGAKRIADAAFIGYGEWQLLLATTTPYCHVSRRRMPKLVLRVPKQVDERGA